MGDDDIVLALHNVAASHGLAEEAAQEILRLRDILVFADGAAKAGLGYALADLYSEDCEWAQRTLREAGCHPRKPKTAAALDDQREPK